MQPIPDFATAARPLRASSLPWVHRFLAGVSLGAGCWEWQKTKRNGYARFGFNGRVCNVHNVVYERLVGPIPDGLELDHVCRNRACCNPLHLEPVTHAENMRRAAVAKTHCKNGHQLTDKNVAFVSTRPNSRVCKLCKKQFDARSYQNRGKRAADN